MRWYRPCRTGCCCPAGLFDPDVGPPSLLLLTGVDSWPLPAPEDAAVPQREA